MTRRLYENVQMFLIGFAVALLVMMLLHFIGVITITDNWIELKIKI